MTAVKPQDLPALFMQALNSGDVESVLSLYEPEGVIAPDPSQVVFGHASIRPMVEAFLAQKPHFVLHHTEVVQTGDIALVRSRWAMSQADSTGALRETSVAPTLVARRQPDGAWLVVIDQPMPVG